MRTFEVVLVLVNVLSLFLSLRKHRKAVWLGKVYYPAEKDDSKPFSRYFRGSLQLIRSYVASNGIPSFLFDQLALVKTNTKEDLQLSDRQQSYPVVLFSHGAGTTIEVQTSQCEDLASHGYIVAAIDHTYVSAATLLPDGIVLASDATAELNTADPAGALSQIMADDAEFVIAKLGEMNEGKIGPAFKGKLNLDEMGAIGHSLGGSVAYNLAINDSRIRAAIDLDGDVYVTPKDVSSMAPLLMLASDDNIQMIQNREPLMMARLEDMSDVERAKSLSLYNGSEEAYDEAYQRAAQDITGLANALEASGGLFTIEGSSHLSFTDLGLLIACRPLRELIGIRGQIDPARCLEITESVTLSFFDHHLKGEPQDSLQSLASKYPELRQVDLS